MFYVNAACCIVIIAALVATTAYAISPNAEHFASIYCETYNLAAWETLSEESSLYETYSLILKKQEEIEFSENFKRALDNINRASFETIFNSTKLSIDKVLGKPWNCLHFDNFYRPKQTVVEINIASVKEVYVDPYDKDTIIIVVGGGSQVLVNGAELSSSDRETIMKGVLSSINERELDSLEFFVYSDEGADGALMVRVLRVLRNFGISRIGLIDY